MQNCKESAGQRIIFTGPDGFGDYRPRSNQSPNVGMGALSPGATSDLSYLWRAAPAAPPPLPKNGYVGEVGWCWQYNSMLNHNTLRSGMQIRKSITRMEVEAQASSKFLQQSKKMTTMQKTQNRD
ncbi:protein SPMIP2-like [Syngnathus typhle]|uniref:protein SPMIP2-like n=1 Tax=Syngnathus typhle TaxID=161592 RepID=UPI002A6B2711|nr:protein SPMIP2-like [Syngnathus typhle]XP_061147825.1 protein SPMIP2-like [Syngnathus typhle]